MTQNRTATTYANLRRRSERLSWTLEEVLGQQPRLDLSRPFLPETMAQTAALPFLSPQQQLALNQQDGCTYARISATFEEGILPFVLDQLRRHGSAPRDQVRALLRFADEEAKHIQLFERYSHVYAEQTGCLPPVAFKREASIAATEQAHPLTTALFSAHVEWMTQSHHVHSSKAADVVDETTLRMLSYHYQEEVQHAHIDELLIGVLGEACSRGEVQEAIAAYRGTCRAVAKVMAHQAELDAQSLQRRTGQELTANERTALISHQQRTMTTMMLGEELSHPRVERAIDALQGAHC